jgi:hypothetical protein
MYVEFFCSGTLSPEQNSIQISIVFCSGLSMEGALTSTVDMGGTAAAAGHGGRSARSAELPGQR